MVRRSVAPMTTVYPPIEELVPHGRSICMLDRLEAWSDGFVHCTAQVREDSPFVRDGQLSSLITLEHLAQTIATYLGYEAHLRGQSPSIGMVVACRDFHVHRPIVLVGENLSIRASMVQGDADRSLFEGEIHSREECIASATLTLVRVDAVKAT